MAVLLLAAALDAVQTNNDKSATNGTRLQGNTEELRLGLELVDEYRSTRLLRCFERPRKQLAKLQMIEARNNLRTEDSGVSIERQMRDTPGFLGDFDMGSCTNLSNFDLDGTLFNLDWINGDWTNPAEPFGVTSWI